MGCAKENIDNYKRYDNALMWVAGTVITGILPYLVMLISWIASDYSKPFLSYYVGITDSAAFMYSVSLCLLLLCLDLDKKIEQRDRSVWGLVSGIFVLLSALLYCTKTILDQEKKVELETMEPEQLMLQLINQNENTSFSSKEIIITSLIMLAITIGFVHVGYGIIKKHEKISEEAQYEDRNNGQECKQVRSEQGNIGINQEDKRIRVQERAGVNIKNIDRKNERAKNERKNKKEKKR